MQDTPEFRVNTTTTGSQTRPTVGMDSGGDMVIAWESSDGSSSGVYADQFAWGSTSGTGELLINAYTTNAQGFPSVAVEEDGDFVIVWESDGQDGSGLGIYAQRFSSSFTAEGSQFRVNTYTSDAQYGPAVAINPDGDFVIVWDSNGQDSGTNGIYAQRFG